MMFDSVWDDVEGLFSWFPTILEDSSPENQDSYWHYVRESKVSSTFQFGIDEPGKFAAYLGFTSKFLWLTMVVPIKIRPTPAPSRD